MPIVSPPATVLVTGASGFIAAWVVKLLLEKGYTVVGTVRSEAKGNYLKTLFKEYSDRDKFKFVIVEDIEKPDAFDEVVKAYPGIEAVEHTASPFHFKANDPQDLIGPAVKGTVGILESIKKYAPKVKRVVITSSVASIVSTKYDAKGEVITGGVQFTEEDWNDESPKVVEEKGRDALGLHKYRASKVLAERAAWEFLQNNKSSVSFDLVTVCPPMVWGPIIHEVGSVESLNTSIADFQRVTSPKSEPLIEEQLKASKGNWVDVRDVANVHVLALDKAEVAGQRFITSSGGFTWQDVLDALHGYPNVPEGKTGSAAGVQHNLYVSKKVEDTFGIKLKTLKETARDTLDALRERGF